MSSACSIIKSVQIFVVSSAVFLLVRLTITVSKTIDADGYAQPLATSTISQSVYTSETMLSFGFILSNHDSEYIVITTNAILPRGFGLPLRFCHIADDIYFPIHLRLYSLILSAVSPDQHIKQSHYQLDD